MKVCCIENCTALCEPNRRYCREHRLQRAREQASARYRKSGGRKYVCTCFMCGRVFNGWRKSSKFCSLECSRAYNKQYAASRDHYSVSHGGPGCTFLHRRIAELGLGRQLTYDEVVHHIDGDKYNNEPHNLSVLSRRDHALLHNAITDQLHEQAPVTEEQVKHVYQKVFEAYCRSGFGVERIPDTDALRALATRTTRERIYKGTTRCKAQTPTKPPRLQHASKQRPRKCEHPTKEELQTLVWSMPSTHIAAHYGVSDTAVAKWCAQYQIEKPGRGYWSKAAAAHSQCEV